MFANEIRGNPHPVISLIVISSADYGSSTQVSKFSPLPFLVSLIASENIWT